MNQEPLFVEDIYQALNDGIRAIKGEYKAVGHALWPEKDIQRAANDLKDCLSRTHQKKLDPEQVIFILKLSKQAGCHVGMNFIADSCEYEKPKSIVPSEKLPSLQKEFIQSAKAMSMLAEEIKKLSTQEVNAE